MERAGGSLTRVVDSSSSRDVQRFSLTFSGHMMSSTGSPCCRLAIAWWGWCLSMYLNGRSAHRGVVGLAAAERRYFNGIGFTW